MSTNSDVKIKHRSCSCFKRCGGCQLDMPYPQQIEWKQSKAKRMLSPFGRVQSIIPMSDPYYYRNKVKTVYRVTSSGKLISGVFQSSTRSVTAAEDCFLEDKQASKIVAQLKKLLASFKITPYDERTGRGILRHSLIRVAAGTGEIMLVLVTKGAILPSKKNLVSALVKSCPEITTVVHNINPDRMPLTLGKRSITLYGSGRITDKLCGCQFTVSPQSFYQVNPTQTQKLYEIVLSAAEVTQGTKILDAYCGVGTIGIICAKNGGQVIGVESDREAVKDAISNAKLNKLDNIRFFNADATQFMCELAYNGEKLDTVILDPPRAGSTEEFVSAVASVSPERVVYVSCKIETLERDLRLFRKAGFKAEFIQPVDMFPHTTGIETVVLLKNTKEK